MSDYWDRVGTGVAWCDRFGNHVDPRKFQDEDALYAAGYHHVDQRGFQRYGGRSATDWIARELGDVPARTTWLDELAQADPMVAFAMALSGATAEGTRRSHDEGQPG